MKMNSMSIFAAEPSGGLLNCRKCSPRERVLGTCVRSGAAEPDCEPVEG